MSCLLILIYYVEPISYGCFVLYLAAARIFPTFAKKMLHDKATYFQEILPKSKAVYFLLRAASFEHHYTTRQ